MKEDKNVEGVVWRALVRLIKEDHTRHLGEGRVLVPQVHLYRDSHCVVAIASRPAQVGPDAVAAITEMSNLPAAIPDIDELVVMWETCDLDVFCGGDVPADRRRELNLLSATRSQRTLFAYSYEEDLLPGRTDKGLLRARPRWLRPSLGVVNPDVPPPIDAVTEFSWRSLEPDAPDMLEHTVTYLTALGHDIVFT